MILLHQGANASDRVRRLAELSTAQVFRRDPAAPLEEWVAALADWIAERRKHQLDSGENPLIVIDSAQVTSEAQREAMASVRRMARWAGIDVHLVGGDELHAFADQVVTDETAAAESNGGAGAAEPELDVGVAEDPPMTPFQQAPTEAPTFEEIKTMTGWPDDRAREHSKLLQGHHIWVNNLYQVNVEYADTEVNGGIGFAHLIVRRRDGRPIRSWTHFQQIKNELIGPQCEAVELYPAERNLVDAKDHYHLWAFTSPEHNFGIGFEHGREVKDRG